MIRVRPTGCAVPAMPPRTVAAGEPTYGFPKLKEILGDAVAARLAEWLGLAAAAARTATAR